MARRTVTGLEEGLDALLDDAPSGLRVVVDGAVPAWLPTLADAASAAGSDLVVAAEAPGALTDADALAGWEIGVLTVVLALPATTVEGVDDHRVRRVQAILDRLSVPEEAPA